MTFKRRDKQQKRKTNAQRKYKTHLHNKNKKKHKQIQNLCSQPFEFFSKLSVMGEGNCERWRLRRN